MQLIGSELCRNMCVSKCIGVLEIVCLYVYVCETQGDQMSSNKMSLLLSSCSIDNSTGVHPKIIAWIYKPILHAQDICKECLPITGSCTASGKLSKETIITGEAKVLTRITSRGTIIDEWRRGRTRSPDLYPGVRPLRLYLFLCVDTFLLLCFLSVVMTLLFSFFTYVFVLFMSFAMCWGSLHAFDRLFVCSSRLFLCSFFLYVFVSVLILPPLVVYCFRSLVLYVCLQFVWFLSMCVSVCVVVLSCLCGCCLCVVFICVCCGCCVVLCVFFFVSLCCHVFYYYVCMSMHFLHFVFL